MYIVIHVRSHTDMQLLLFHGVSRKIASLQKMQYGNTVPKEGQA